MGKDIVNNLTISIGNRELKSLKVTNDNAKFLIPKDIEPGIYLLRFKSEKKEIFYPLNITIKKQEFYIKRYYPESIDRCANGILNINVEGDNLDLVKKITMLETGNLKFYSNKNKISIEIPTDKLNNFSNSLNIYLYDDNEKIRDIVPIRINNKPFIDSIDIIQRDVTSLTLKILGKNFIHPIKLFVNDEVIREKDRDSRHLGGQKSSPNLDRFEFINCKEIIYKIYPTTFDTQNILVSIENPTGDKSNTFSITIP